MITKRFDDRPGNKVLLDLCKEVFGEGAVDIKNWWAWNDVTVLLSCPVDFGSFIKNFKMRLERLQMRFIGTDSYAKVLATVAQLADKKRCEKAYAKLAAWDIMWNNYLMIGMEVDENGRGHVEDNDLYFDVGLLGPVLNGAGLKRTMKDCLYMQVLVNAPIFIYSHEDYSKMNADFYEQLAQRTFCNNPKAMKNLAGFIVIDDGLDKDWHECHVLMNPNAAYKSNLVEFYLDTLNCSHDDLGILDSFFDYMGWEL